MAELLTGLLTDYTLRTVALGVALIGAVAGALGTFAVLRRQSLVGDAISHAALPGVALAFLITLSKHPLVLLVGAALAGWLGTLAVMAITRTTRIKQDTALGIVLSVFFGIGLVILRVVQDLPTAGKAGLDRFLFGSAASMLRADVLTAAVLGALALALLLVFWKEFKLLSFDAEYMAAQGWPVRLLDVLLTSLIVLAIVIGLQAVGVVLMSALLIAPAAAARQWSNQLGLVALLAALLGALSGVTGALVSSSVPRLSTGPTIVLVACGVVVLSLLLAPARGLLWDHLRHLRQHREVEAAAVLGGLLRLAESHGEPTAPHDIAALDAVGLHAAQSTMPLLEKRGLAERAGAQWRLTPAGYAEARRVQGTGGADG